MTDVSTRPQVEATRRPKAAKTQTSAAAPGNVDWTDTLPIVCTRAATMLRVVAERLSMGSAAESGFRLSALAASTLESVAASDRWADLDALDNHLLDVCALITSAKGTEGESIDSNLVALLGYALELVSALVATRCNDPLQGDVDLMHELLREPMPDLPVAQPMSGTEFDPLHGHTPAQVAMALEFIATNANVARRYCDATTDEHFSRHIAASMFEQIGMLADHILDYDIVGNPAAWMVGSSFADARKAVQA